MSDALVEYAATRDLELRNELVVRHLPLVKFVARKMSSNLPENVELDDLVSWGSIGLIDAIEKFEPQRGLQFSTYAVTRIRGEILDGLQRMEWAPKQITSQVRKMKRVVEDLRHELGRDPAQEEVAERMGLSMAEVSSLRVDMSAVRLKALGGWFTQDGLGSEERDGDFESSKLAEEADQEVAGEVAEIRSSFVAALSPLDNLETRMLLLYYNDAKTLREIAAELGISVSSATQAHTRLVERIRRRLADTHGTIAA